MRADQTPPERLRFGVFEVDLRAGELRKHGLKLRLQEQPFQILTLLLERAGEVVTREELQKRLWQEDTYIDFDHGLNKAISKIRDALGDSADSPRFIETVARRGYRFLADVKVVALSPLTAAETTPDQPEVNSSEQHPHKLEIAEPSPDGHSNRPYIWGISAVIALGLLIFAVSFFRSRKTTSNEVNSIAVLPLESLSNDTSQDYFADGMTDQLITDLGQIGALRVISRTTVMQYKGVHKPMAQIGRELNVEAIVEGTVLRSGNRVRITAQLIQAAEDKHIWAHSYEGDLRDSLSLQNQVARAVAEQIKVSLNPQEAAILRSRDTVNPEAYLSYLRGRFFWNKRTADGLQLAVSYFKQAIHEDPSYAQAYSGLADAYALLGDWQYGAMSSKEALPMAKAASLRAIELNSTLGEAHNSLGFCLDGFDWDFVSAEKEFKKAIELNPGYATAHHWYAWHLALVGKNVEAISEMRKALNLDPLSLIINADLAELLLIAHKYDESIEQSRKTLEMDPNFALAHNQLGQALLQKNRNDAAILELRKAVQLSEGSPVCTANLARAYALAGRKSEAQVLLRELKIRSHPSYSNASEIALVSAALGETDEAMAWLEKGYEEKFNPGALLRPGFDGLRSTPRFRALVHRIGLNS
jgi:TolB-like protein/DNA-binding winged helix-turn-helix (wHTH) protein/Flp pilus assembly protein TadD